MVNYTLVSHPTQDRRFLYLATNKKIFNIQISDKPRCEELQRLDTTKIEIKFEITVTLHTFAFINFKSLSHPSIATKVFR